MLHCFVVDTSQDALRVTSGDTREGEEQCSAIITVHIVLLTVNITLKRTIKILVYYVL